MKPNRILWELRQEFQSRNFTYVVETDEHHVEKCTFFVVLKRKRWFSKKIEIFTCFGGHFDIHNVKKANRFYSYIKSLHDKPPQPPIPPPPPPPIKTDFKLRGALD